MCDPLVTCQVQASHPYFKERDRSCADFYLETFLFLDGLHDIQLSWEVDGKKDVRFSVIGIPEVLAYRGEELLSVFSVGPTQSEVEKSEVEMDHDQWFNMKYAEFCSGMKSLEGKGTKPDKFSVQVEFLCTKRGGEGGYENLPGGTVVTVGNTPWFIPRKWTVRKDKKTLSSPPFLIKQSGRKGGDLDSSSLVHLEAEKLFQQMGIFL